MRKRNKELKPTKYWENLLNRSLMPKGATIASALPAGFPGDPDHTAAEEFVKQIKMLAAAGLAGYPITESWYAPPEAHE